MRDERAKGIEAAYLRDRDFDFDPPHNRTGPIEDRWSRHAIENYLIDQEIVTRALGWDRGEYAAALVTAAQAIRDYQIARWVIGDVRRHLPPNHDLRTTPDGIDGDFVLPALLTEAGMREWVLGTVAAFHQRADAAANPPAVEKAWRARAAAMTAAACQDAEHALSWFSGKNLLAALAPWLHERGVVDPGRMRARLRDWVLANPAEARAILLEWGELLLRLRE